MLYYICKHTLTPQMSKQIYSVIRAMRKLYYFGKEKKLVLTNRLSCKNKSPDFHLIDVQLNF